MPILFTLKINIQHSRWFLHGGNDLYMPLVKDEHEDPVITSQELTAFIEKATKIPYWVDPDEQINPNLEHTISWCLKP